MSFSPWYNCRKCVALTYPRLGGETQLQDASTKISRGGQNSHYVSRNPCKFERKQTNTHRSSQFKNFKSTFNNIKAPRPPYNNSRIIDDPRASVQSAAIAKSAKIYRPYPDYNSEEWKRTHRGAFVPCVGPRGKTLDDSLDDSVSVYVGVPESMFPYTLVILLHD